MRLYLGGPMRGYVHFNAPAFIKATALLRADGHEVYSPVEYDARNGVDHTGSSGDYQDIPEFNLREALAAGLTWICAEADGVVVLPGWQASLGATAEAFTALTLSLPVWELDPFLLYGPDASTVRGLPALARAEATDA